MADKNVLQGEYRLGIVKEVFPGADGKAQRVLITYKNFRVGDIGQTYMQCWNNFKNIRVKVFNILCIYEYAVSKRF